MKLNNFNSMLAACNQALVAWRCLVEVAGAAANAWLVTAASQVCLGDAFDGFLLDSQVPSINA